MSDFNKPSIVYWIIGVLALAWNGMGVNSYLQTAFKSEAVWSELSTEQVTFMDNLPAWLTALFALAVFGGLLGSIGLLLRKKWAAPLFVISFLCATVQQLYLLFGTEMQDVFGERNPLVMPILIIVFGAFLVWYSKNAKSKGILS